MFKILLSLAIIIDVLGLIYDVNVFGFNSFTSMGIYKSIIIYSLIIYVYRKNNKEEK